MYHEAQNAMSPRASIAALPKMNASDYDRLFNEQSSTSKAVKITNVLFDNAMNEMSKSLERVLVNSEDVKTVLDELQTTVVAMYAE